jgi:hypothetical protein
MEENFKTRTYAFGELAKLYFPNVANKSATKQLRIWLNINSRLGKRLVDCGYISKQRILTPAQVKIIIEELGEP